VAAAFADMVDQFTGIDISPAMIEKARATGLYAELEVTDMLEGLRTTPDSGIDLVLAADAMVYVADLVPVLQQASRVLAPGGLLAFTLERHDGEVLSWVRAGATRIVSPMCARHSRQPVWWCCSLNSNRSAPRQACPCRAL
jgi:predicted TPR repeat methyltransferase